MLIEWWNLLTYLHVVSWREYTLACVNSVMLQRDGNDSSGINRRSEIMLRWYICVNSWLGIQRGMAFSIKYSFLVRYDWAPFCLWFDLFQKGVSPHLSDRNWSLLRFLILHSTGATLGGVLCFVIMCPLSVSTDVKKGRFAKVWDVDSDSGTGWEEWGEGKIV